MKVHIGNLLGVWYRKSLYFDKTTWIYVVFAYLFLVSVMPMWFLAL